MGPPIPRPQTHHIKCLHFLPYPSRYYLELFLLLQSGIKNKSTKFATEQLRATKRSSVLYFYVGPASVEHLFAHLLGSIFQSVFTNIDSFF